MHSASHKMLSFGESSIHLGKFNSLDEFVKAHEGFVSAAYARLENFVFFLIKTKFLRELLGDQNIMIESSLK
jgi:hypothetical protein